MTDVPDDPKPYAVYIWYAGGSYQRIDYGLEGKAAIERAKTITDMIQHIPGAVSVTVVDRDDFTVFKWDEGKGVVFPTQKQTKGASPPPDEGGSRPNPTGPSDE